MRYCVQCGQEYQDEAKECTDCGGTELVSEQELHRRGKRRWDEQDTRRFATAGTAEDFLTSERLIGVLQNAQIPVLPRSRLGGTVDPITSSSSPWWEILVPEEHLAKATELIRQERLRIEAEAAEATRAAEEEEAQSEVPPPSERGSR